MFHAFGARGGSCAWDLSVQVLVCRSQCAYSRREYTSSGMGHTGKSSARGGIQAGLTKCETIECD